MSIRSRLSAVCLFLFVATVFLGGCSANRVLTSHADPQMAGKIKGKVLVVTVSHRETPRKLIEESCVRQLSGLGIPAIPSFEVTVGDNPVTYDQAVAAIKKSGAATVLVMQLDSVSSKTIEQLATGSKYDTLDKLEVDPIFFVPQPKVTSRTTTRAKIVSRLYDVQSRKLVWSAVTESKEPVMTRSFADSLVKVILSDLQSKQLL